MSRKLVITDGTRERELQLIDRLVVGRDPACDISADHSLLSRRHAEFVTVGATVTIRDLGSRNGVFVNGSRTAERALDPGDVVQIGPLRARYLVDDVPLSITPEVLDGDRTAMLLNRAAQAAPAPDVTVLSIPFDETPGLDDTVVPSKPVDEDVTRMVSAPAPAVPERLPAVPPELEVTRFTPAPAPPEVTAVIQRPAIPADIPDAERSTADVAPPAYRGGPPVSGFVMAHAQLLACGTAATTLVATAIAPGVAGILLSFVIAAGAAFGVAGMITRRAPEWSAKNGRPGERS